jgi:hypothetical protein
MVPSLPKDVSVVTEMRGALMLSVIGSEFASAFYAFALMARQPGVFSVAAFWILITALFALVYALALSLAVPRSLIGEKGMSEGLYERFSYYSARNAFRVRYIM